MYSFTTEIPKDSQRSRLVGILGGMGPAATADFYFKLIRHTPATCDQDHIRVAIWADPSVPSRQDALLCGGKDPTSALKYGISQLVKVGADIIVSPCNTAHAFIRTILKPKTVEFIDIVEVTVNSILQHSEMQSVGLLATDGTLSAGLYQHELSARGYRVIIPDRGAQDEVMQLIAGVKANISQKEAANRLVDIITALEWNGANTVIVACTELSYLLTTLELLPCNVQILDPSEELARATVQRAIKV